MKTYTLEGRLQKTVMLEVPGHSLEIEAGQEVVILIAISDTPQSFVRCDCWKVCPDKGCEAWAIHRAADSILHDCTSGWCDAVDQDAQCIPVKGASDDRTNPAISD